jgi:hypothetical protein
MIDTLALLIYTLTLLANLRDQSLLGFILEVSTTLRSINISVSTREDCIDTYTIIVLYPPNLYLIL